jgi:hypothetical protein
MGWDHNLGIDSTLIKNTNWIWKKISFENEKIIGVGSVVDVATRKSKDC